MKLKTVEIKNFKGISDTVILFGDSPVISGPNGSGKTSILEAILWAFADKDYALKSNPYIRTLGNEDAVPSVTITASTAAGDIVFSKTQERKVSESDSGAQKVALTNRYTLNGVPLTERDVKKRLLDFDIDVDKFVFLAHPDYFVSQKGADMRKILFGMATSVSPVEIASKSEDLQDVAKLLGTYTIEEITAMNKAMKRKADEEIKGIPWQITGIQDAKNAVDVSAISEEREGYNAKIAELMGQIETIRNDAGDAKALMDESRSLQHKIADTERMLNKNSNKEKKEAAEKITKLRLANSKLQAEGNRLTMEGENLEFQIKNLKTVTDDLRKRLATRKAEEFKIPFTGPKPLSEKERKCPTCGQDLPEDRWKDLVIQHNLDVEKAKKDYEDYKKNWEDEKAADIASMVKKGNANISEMKQLKEDLTKCLDKYKENQEQQKSMKEEIEKAVAHEQGIVEVTPEDSEELAQMKSRLNEVTALLGKCNEANQRISTITSDISDIKAKDLAAKAKVENLGVLDQKIADLQVRRDALEMDKAMAEKVLYQLDLLGRKMNELLSEEINSHFGVVKWVLFDYQKNGEYKEVCIPTIDGKRFGESLNTGREIIGKIDICESLQKFYGMPCPILLDGAESLNDFNVPKTNTQLILSKVTNDKKMVVT